MLADKAPAHTANMSRECIEACGIRGIRWPGNSPDLNPIENAFGLIKGKLLELDCSTREKVIEHVERIWNELDQEYFRNLARSMPKRIAMCIENNYGSIKY